MHHRSKTKPAEAQVSNIKECYGVVGFGLTTDFFSFTFGSLCDFHLKCI